jgi:TetR/AcrR family acrAB operon transcriptional repressor
MARKTKEEAEETRLRILTAAEDVFSRQGIATSTLHDIARRAGVTRGAVYWHFADKEALLATLLEGPLPLEDLTPGANLADDFERLLDTLLAALRDRGTRRLLRILLLQAQWDDAQPYVQARITRARRHFTRHLEQMLRQALAAGELREGLTDADIAPTALALKAIVTGLVYEFVRQPRMPQRDNQVRRVMREFFSSVCRGAGRAPAPSRAAWRYRRRPPSPCRAP